VVYSNHLQNHYIDIGNVNKRKLILYLFYCQFLDVWQEKGKFNEPKLTLPKALQGRQLNIIDPLHEPDPNALPDETTPWISPTRHPMFEYLVPPLPREQHPLFHHDKPVFLFDSKTKLHAGKYLT
jgi:hypothetical protein